MSDATRHVACGCGCTTRTVRDAVRRGDLITVHRDGLTHVVHAPEHVVMTTDEVGAYIGDGAAIHTTTEDATLLVLGTPWPADNHGRAVYRITPTTTHLIDARRVA